ncbi:MAG TPA: YihY/virulence factor BrkB family protein [Thermomicrobiales bacterium]|jgi:YihY family inner membrane protein|nr:YihY/virulence factor BrkB family protein [Thermomicrobiales bacterium]
MILLDSAAHAKVKGHRDEKREVQAVSQTLPFLWRRTRHAGWFRFLRIPRWMYRGYTRNQAGDLAASIAYHALIAMVPIFFLLVGVGGLFLRNDDVMSAATRGIQRIFPEGSGSTEAFRAALEARQNSGLVSLVSFIGFAWVGTGLISSMARGMNRIYGVRNPSFIVEKQRGFVVIMLFLLFFIISVLASVLPTFLLLLDLPDVVDEFFLTSRFNQLVAYSVALVSTLMLFLVIYRIVPNARQTLADVWPGTLVASVLFFALVQVFPIYTQLVGGVNRYGQLLGLITLIVVALFFLSHVILFGAYINATWQRNRARRAQEARMRKAREDDDIVTAEELANGT